VVIAYRSTSLWELVGAERALMLAPVARVIEKLIKTSCLFPMPTRPVSTVLSNSYRDL